MADTLSPAEQARASVAEAMGTMAVFKNVPLTDEERAKSAEGVLAGMDLAQMHQLSALDRDGLAARSKAVNAWLDMIAMSRLATVVASIEGKDDPTDPAVLAVAGEIVSKLEASLTNKNCTRWPSLVELVQGHYAGKARGPTVAVGEDGTIYTRWWLGMLDFHRDPKEGPANIEEKGDRRSEEYWVKGQLHRPHEDGPAMIYTHYNEEFDLSGEEYFESGKWHRPSELGPAVMHWDRTGEAVMEGYFENGQLHRDPKLGPAWWGIRDVRTDRNAAGSCSVIRYCVRGQHHRDEEDGPAYIVRDEASGVVLIERYWRDGVMHRDRGPAETERKADGTLFRELWVCDGQWHRAPGEGPAVIIRDTDKGTVREEFWVEGNYWPAPDCSASVRRGADGGVMAEDGVRMHARPAAPDFASKAGEGGQPETMKAGTHG